MSLISCFIVVVKPPIGTVEKVSWRMHQFSVFQRFQWSGTLCSSFDCSRNPCL